METILFLSHTDQDGKLPAAGLESLAAARELAQELKATLVAGLFGREVQPAAAQLAGAGEIGTHV